MSRKPKKPKPVPKELVAEAQKLITDLQGLPPEPVYVWKKTMSGDDVASMLKKNGWDFTHQDGSHMNYKKHGRSVTVPKHKELKKGTLSSIKKRVLEIEKDKKNEKTN